MDRHQKIELLKKVEAGQQPVRSILNPIHVRQIINLDRSTYLEVTEAGETRREDDVEGFKAKHYEQLSRVNGAILWHVLEIMDYSDGSGEDF